MTLELRGVTAVDGDGRVVLDDVDLSLEPGRVLALVGPNGAGKTALLEVLAGLRPIVKGEIGTSEGSSDGKGPTVAWLPVEPVLVPPSATVRRWLAAAGVPEPPALLGLAPLMARSLESLPARERRSVWLAAALGAPARVCLLDEPALGLDRERRRVVAELIRGLATGGAAVAVATVDPGFGAACADRAGLMVAGELRWLEPLEGPSALTRLEDAWRRFVVDAS